MATLMTHGIFASLLMFLWRKKEARFRLVLMIFFASIIPDIDLLFPVDRSRIFSHRGITHSFFFAFIIGGVFSSMFLFEVKSIFHTILLFFIFTMAVVSHLFLDAMTQAQQGVCFFCPFSEERIFLPFQPFQTYSGGYSRGVGNTALLFMLPEILWVWIPSILFFGMFLYMESFGKNSSSQSSKNTVQFKPVKSKPREIPKNIRKKK